jgi:hypothetical protein
MLKHYKLPLDYETYGKVCNVTVAAGWEWALNDNEIVGGDSLFVSILVHYCFWQVLTLDQIQQLSGPVAQQLLSSHRLKPKVAEGLEDRRKAIQGAVSQTSSDQMLLSVS